MSVYECVFCLLPVAMETEVSDLTDQENSVLSPETENTLLISLAGLKQVRHWTS